MFYLDSRIRSSTSALGHWLSQEIASEVAHIRLKTGYFTINGLAAIKDHVGHIKKQNLPITLVLGANDKSTIKADVDAVFGLIGCPRDKAKIFVVSCAGGLFHPKVIHLTRSDGSQFAYVGSANLTPAGVNGSNIECGIMLDSRKGDPLQILSDIGASIDAYAVPGIAGVTEVLGPAGTQQLVDDGILGIVAPPRPAGVGGSTSGAGTSQKVPLKPLVSFPPLFPAQGGSSSTTPAPSPMGQSPTTQLPSSTGDEILVAEIGKGVRWKQANFPFAVMRDYFGVNPTASEHIDLYPVSANGGQSAPVDTQVVNVQSQNYRIELTSVAGLPYPTNGRPIGVFRKIGPRKFRYRIFFPGDVGYVALNGGLVASYVGPARELRRVVMNSASLSAICPTCPV